MTEMLLLRTKAPRPMMTGTTGGYDEFAFSAAASDVVHAATATNDNAGVIDDDDGGDGNGSPLGCCSCRYRCFFMTMIALLAWMMTLTLMIMTMVPIFFSLMMMTLPQLVLSP